MGSSSRQLSHPQGPNISASGHPGKPDVWSAVFVLGRTFDDAQRTHLDLARSIGASILNFSGSAALCLRVEGPMDTALAHAVRAVSAAFASAELPFDVIETRMVSVNDALVKAKDGDPVSYYTVTECAAALGVSSQRARQLLKGGQLPPPDGFANGAPLWSVSEFEQFATQRRALLDGMPLGLNWRYASEDPTSRLDEMHQGGVRFLATRIDDTAVLPGGRKASLEEVLAIRDQLVRNG